MSTTLIIIGTALLLIILFGLFIWNIVRVKGQIRTFFYEYKKSKNRKPNKNERYHLKRVLRMMRMKDGRRLKDTSISPEQYFKEVFDDIGKDPDIDDLIYHMIMVGNPDYSSHDWNLEQIREARRKNEKTKRQKLKELISQVHKEVMGSQDSSIINDVNSSGNDLRYTTSIIVSAIIVAGAIITFAIIIT